MSDRTQREIGRVCDSIRDLLLEKNRKYGDSALEPVRVMSQASAVEQILVRIDDKLSRISRGTGLVGDDEDVIQDLIGYFILLKIAVNRQSEDSINESASSTEHLLGVYDKMTREAVRDKFDGVSFWDPTTGPIE